MDGHGQALPTRQKSHLKLPRLSASLGAPPAPSGASFLPLGVPIPLWEGAKKKFFQQGGLTTSEAVCQFLSSITLADMLPHNVKDWLEVLAVREGQILMHQLEEHHLHTAANATYYRTPRGSMKHTKSSFGSKKFLSFKHHSNQDDTTGAQRLTPRGAASRLTPRKQSVQNTPLDDSFGSLVQAQSLVVDDGPVRKSAVGRPRLQLDLHNVHLVEQTLVNVLPLRLVNKIPPSPAAAGVQQLAASSPTFDAVKECGSFSLEQFALLLSYFAQPDIDTTSKGGEDLATQKGNVFSFLEEMSADAFLPSLIDGELERGTGHEVDLMEASSRPGSPSHTFACLPGSVASNVEILLESFGMSPQKIFASGSSSSTKALTQEDHEATYKTAIDLLLTSNSDLRRGSIGAPKGNDDDDGDVLLRLTPPESRSHSADHSSHHHHHHHSKHHLSSMHRSRSAMDTLPPLANTYQSLKLKAPTTAGLMEVQGEWVSSPVGDASPDNGFSEQSTARSMSSTNLLPKNALAKVRSNVSVAPSTSMAKTDSVLKKNSDVQTTAEYPKKRPISVTVATQTECISFTLMWLGPIRRSIGTTTRPTGDVGKVVSLTMVKVEKRRKERQMERVRGALASLESDPKALVRASGKRPLPLTATDYSCMSIEQMKQLYDKSAESTRPSLRALKQQTQLAREAEAALKINHTFESGEFDDDSLGATMIL